MCNQQDLHNRQKQLSVEKTREALHHQQELLLQQHHMYQRHLQQVLFILLPKTTAAQNEVALSYHRVRGLYFVAAVFAVTIVLHRNV